MHWCGILADLSKLQEASFQLLQQQWACYLLPEVIRGISRSLLYPIHFLLYFLFHNPVKLIYIQVQLHWGFAPHAYILTTVYNTMITCPKMVQKSEGSWGECNRERTKSHSSWYLTLGCWLSPCRLLLAHFTRSTIQLYTDDKSHWFHIPRFYVQVLNGASCHAFIYNQFLTNWEWQFLWLGLQYKHDISWNGKEKKNI